LLAHLPPDLPQSLADKIKAAIFDTPDVSGLADAEKNALLDAYANAARSVFYLWFAAIR
jgi:hypothetical protein